MKETGKIHYLKPPEPPEPEGQQAATYGGETLRHLEDRLDRIEAGLRETLQKVERREGVRTGQERAELSSLIRHLEEKIQKVSEEMRALHRPPSPGPAKALEDFFNFNFNFKKIGRLIDLWIHPKEEDYEVDEFGMDPAFVKRAKPFFDFLYYQYWRVSVSGIHNIPSEGRGLIVANHSGTLPYDGAMIRLAAENDHPSRRDVRFLVEDFVYHFPFLGTFMYRIGGVRACPENAEHLLTREHLVTVFPEGVKGIGKHYKNRYRLQRFGRGGFIKLALKTNSPIIPTAVIGAEEIHPLIYKSTLLARPLGVPYLPITPTLPWLGLLGLIPLPSKWSIIFGEPIRFSPKYKPQDAENQLLVNQLSEKVRERIQEMIIEALKHRRSVWFG